MKFVFIDETANSAHLPGFYAVCAVAIDATKYKIVRTAVEDSLLTCGWCTDREFKGSLIFAASKGDKAVSVESRIDAVSSMISATVSKASSRVSAAVAWSDEGQDGDTHLTLVGKAVSGCLKAKPSSGKQGKDLCVVFADEKYGLGKNDLSVVVKDAVSARGFYLVEDVTTVSSSCSWPGVMLADILAYLAMWTYVDHKLGSRQISLFDSDSPTPGDAVLRKMATVREMLESGSELVFLPKLPRQGATGST